MANFEDLKKKARDAFDTITDVSVEAYKLAEERAKGLAHSTRLKTDISRDNALIRRMYVELGAMYYNLHKDNPEEAFVQNCTEVTSALERIAERQKELDEMKKNGSINDDDSDDTTPPDDNA